MNIKSDCLSCLLNQTLRVTKHLSLDEEMSQQLVRKALLAISSYGEVSPPIAASDLYPKLADMIGVVDIYKELKEYSTLEAQKLLPSVEKIIFNQADRLQGAIKASVAGNVIDFATPNHFDLEEEFSTVFETAFTLDDESEFFEKLSRTQNFMIIGDNVGEHIFDKVLLEEISNAYPDIKLYYAVRGIPIINDVTLKEAKEINIEDVATLVDSGVDTPGLAYVRASDQFMELYATMDLIIAKGMGNYECLEGVGDERIYHLFKVKCDVVANAVGVNLGDLIFKKNIDL